MIHLKKAYCVNTRGLIISSVDENPGNVAYFVLLLLWFLLLLPLPEELIGHKHSNQKSDKLHHV
jgi:hypothetical protein